MKRNRGEKGVRGRIVAKRGKRTNLEPLVLQDLFDRDLSTILGPTDELGLVDDSKGTVSYDGAACVGDFSVVAGLSIEGVDGDDFVRIIYWSSKGGGRGMR